MWVLHTLSDNSGHWSLYYWSAIWTKSSVYFLVNSGNFSCGTTDRGQDPSFFFGSCTLNLRMTMIISIKLSADFLLAHAYIMRSEVNGGIQVWCRDAWATLTKYSPKMDPPLLFFSLSKYKLVCITT